MGRENTTGDAFTPRQTAELEDLFRSEARKIKLTIRTHIPAKVLLYNPATNTATIQLQMLQVVRVVDPTRLPSRVTIIKGTPPNQEATLAPVELKEIPVVWPRTKSGWITFPLTTGDEGMVHISDRSLEAWKQLGNPVDPVFAFTHALKDSTFHPGLSSTVNPIVPPPDVAATVIEGKPMIKLGPLAVEGVVKDATLLTELINAVTATTTVPTDGGASFKTTLLAQLALIVAKIGTPAGIGSVKAKVE